VSNAFHVPFMETRWDYTGKRADFSINVHPHPAKIGKAYADFVKKVAFSGYVSLMSKIQFFWLANSTLFYV
jgi:hypothetical protein